MTSTQPQDASERHLRFRPDIEGLRAVAILLVVLYHAGWRWASSGFLGVDVFFVLSGFLISGLLLDEVTATGRVSLTRFWARRARRLLPAAALITLVVLALNAALLSPFDQIDFAATARAFAVYVSNVLFAIRSTDYFGGAAVRDPLLHSWSLSVEEQFYLFFAPLMLALAAWSRASGSEVMRRRFTQLVVLGSIASFAGCLLLVRRYPVIAFYALPSRAWEFGLGALAVVAARRIGKLGHGTLEIMSIAGLLAMLGAASFVKEGSVAPLGITTLLPALGTVALILGGAGTRPTLVGRALATAPMRLVGRLSYSWYLWHWPMLVYLRDRVPNPSLLLSVGVALSSLIPAAITYKLIESPIRFSKGLQHRARQVVLGAIALAVFTALAATAASQYARHTLATPRYANILAARAQPRTYADGCQVSLTAVVSPPCKYGPGTNDTTIVLFGDSHAAQWFPAFDSLATLRGWTLVNLTKRGCPSVSATFLNPRLGRAYTECDTWRQYAIDRIVKLRPTLVVVTNARSYNLIVGNERPHTDSSAVARRIWHDAMIKTLVALAPSKALRIVLEDTEHPSVDVPTCLVQNIDDPERCAVSAQRTPDSVASSSERNAVFSVPGVAYISMNDVICPAGHCPAIQDGLVRYQDNSHISVRFAKSLVPSLSAALSRALTAPPRPK